MKLALFAAILAFPMSAFACEQYASDGEIIDFIDRDRFVVVAGTSADLYFITGTGTGTQSLMASAGPDKAARFRYGDDSVFLNEREFKCSDAR